MQSFVGLFRWRRWVYLDFFTVWAFCPPPRFLSWLVLPHPVGAYHPWALVLVLSGNHKDRPWEEATTRSVALFDTLLVGERQKRKEGSVFV